MLPPMCWIALSHFLLLRLFCLLRTERTKTKPKLICHHNTELIPPLSINFLLQELRALSQVANRVEVISSWILLWRASRAL